MEAKIKAGKMVMKQVVELVKTGRSMEAESVLIDKASAACPDKAAAQKIVFAIQKG